MAADGTITEILRTAHESVVAAEIPEKLQAVGLEKAVELLAVRQGLTPAAAPATAREATAGKTKPPTPGSGEDRSLEKLAGALGVGVETVGEVFHIDGESLSLGIGTGQLPSASSPAVKEIALLIAGGRQLGGWDAEWTAASEIRPVAETYGKFDGNFAASLTDMEDEFSFNGSGSGRKVKLKRKGRENLTDLVKRLAGEE